LAGHVLHLQEEVERAIHRIEDRGGSHLEPSSGLTDQAVLDLYRVSTAS
jgi:hypothetical protein